MKGHALLVGVGGSGKQSSLSWLFCRWLRCFRNFTSRGYDETNFREDLKTLYHKLGIEGKKTTFLFTTSRRRRGFLELINNMLTTGAVPALFADDEKDGIINNVRDEAAKAGYPPGKEAIWSYFINKCADNLHIILAMSPTGDTLRVRCRNFPGLVNNTVIDWFDGWPTQALLAVASSFLTDNQMIPENHMENVINHVVFVHKTGTELGRLLEEAARTNFVILRTSSTSPTRT